MKRAIWLSFDLGITGDYESMYAWLEDHQAKECGASMAYIRSYEFDGNLMETLNSDIAANVDLNHRSRIYLIFSENGRAKGRYLRGNRRAPPWTGYGCFAEQEDDEALELN